MLGIPVLIHWKAIEVLLCVCLCVNDDLVITGEGNVKLLSMSVSGCGPGAHTITLGRGAWTLLKC